MSEKGPGFGGFSGGAEGQINSETNKIPNEGEPGEKKEREMKGIELYEKVKEIYEKRLSTLQAAQKQAQERKVEDEEEKELFLKYTTEEINYLKETLKTTNRKIAELKILEEAIKTVEDARMSKISPEEKDKKFMELLSRASNLT